ncbi:MAG: hypothetical protein LQ347_003898 [Umbilicaria vellea]|nr:MAG: hypothetical protein LQ347_003898 [Umbilicaria vellea]
MNLLMHAPLCDSSGNVRYYLGAQVDVSSVFMDGVGLDSLLRVIDQQNRRSGNKSGEPLSKRERKTDFQQLSEMFDAEELRTVQDWGRRTSHTSTSVLPETESARTRRLGMVPRDPSLEHLSIPADINLGPKSCGYYAHYLLVRPYPSLRILFAAPSLRVPELIQSPIMDKIGGSARVRDELLQALAAGRGVTARIRWISRADEEGRRRWIHFTPLLRKDGQIGVWVVILVDDEEMQSSSASDSSNLDTQRETETTFPSVASPMPLRHPERSPHHAPPVTVTPPIVPARDHRAKISWSGPEVAHDLRRPSLHWVPEKKFETPLDDTLSVMTIDSANTAMTGVTGYSGMSGETADDEVTLDSLEERLRRKRARDAKRIAARAGEDGFLTGRQTYKSLSPYSFMEVE